MDRWSTVTVFHFSMSAIVTRVRRVRKDSEPKFWNYTPMPLSAPKGVPTGLAVLLTPYQTPHLRLSFDGGDTVLFEISDGSDANEWWRANEAYSVELLDIILTKVPDHRGDVASCDEILVASNGGLGYQYAPAAASLEDLCRFAAAGATFRVFAKVLGCKWPPPLPQGESILLEVMCQEFIDPEGASWRQLLVADLAGLRRTFPAHPGLESALALPSVWSGRVRHLRDGSTVWLAMALVAADSEQGASAHAGEGASATREEPDSAVPGSLRTAQRALQAQRRARRNAGEQIWHARGRLPEPAARGESNSGHVGTGDGVSAASSLRAPAAPRPAPAPPRLRERRDDDEVAAVRHGTGLRLAHSNSSEGASPSNLGEIGEMRHFGAAAHSPALPRLLERQGADLCVSVQRSAEESILFESSVPLAARTITQECGWRIRASSVVPPHVVRITPVVLSMPDPPDAATGAHSKAVLFLAAASPSAAVLLVVDGVLRCWDSSNAATYPQFQAVFDAYERALSRKAAHTHTVTEGDCRLDLLAWVWSPKLLTQRGPEGVSFSWHEALFSKASAKGARRHGCEIVKSRARKLETRQALDAGAAAASALVPTTLVGGKTVDDALARNRNLHDNYAVGLPDLAAAFLLAAPGSPPPTSRDEIAASVASVRRRVAGGTAAREYVPVSGERMPNIPDLGQVPMPDVVSVGSFVASVKGGSSELTAADVAHKPAEAIKSVGSIPVWQAADALYKIDNPAWVCAVPDLPAPPGFATHEAIDVVHQSFDVDLSHLITRATATAPRLAGYLYAASKALHEHDDEMMDDSAPPSYTVGPLNAPLWHHAG